MKIEDPHEKNNLFDFPSYSDRIKTMREDLEGWYSRYVNPRFDGRNFPITGRGQKARADEEDALTYRFFE